MKIKISYLCFNFAYIFTLVTSTALHGMYQEETYRPDVSPLFQSTPAYIDMFSPEDNIRGALIELISREEKSIYMAMYFLVDGAVIKALKKAIARGVTVEIIVDQGCPQKQLDQLTGFATIQIYTLTRGLMHHKFALFTGLKIVGEGSYNVTYSAQYRNRENFSFFAYKQENDIFYPRFQHFYERFCSLRSKAIPYFTHSRHDISEDKEIIENYVLITI